ncbi:P-loop containing nucleoside triphosphate hydrolase [Sesbania bispinosa]|nr:P-loop containing nucleoside triphosphate hydrolase [Sesbania bispinosa]
MQEHKEYKPMVLSAEFVGEAFEENAKEIWKLLEDDKVFLICIYGMGGVGKTLLITEVVKEIRRKGSFKEIIWVTVSEDYSISKLQDYIADKIGIKLDAMDDERAEKLSLELQKKEKALLILDDVWKYIDLEKVGIPPPIKVVMTSRLQHLCRQMDCPPNNMIQMSCLYTFEGEDWELFLLKLGYHGTPAALNPALEKIGRRILKRCGGLPLAICVMARMMKGLNGIHRWKHALNKLENLEMREEMEEQVFKVLKRSYDNLVDKKMQNCFLYCALSNYNFDRDEYVMMFVENGLIKGMRSLEEIFDEGHTIFDKLQSHSLFTIGMYTYPLVTMARHILKEIQSQREVMIKFKKRFTESEWTTDLEWVFLPCKKIKEIPEGMSPCCPRLSNLILSRNDIRSIPECFFVQMNALAILDLSWNRKLTSLPNSLSNLRSLISLVLRACDSLEDVPPLGKLQNLSRLVITRSSIKKVPEGLEKLIKLKWLDLSRNQELRWEPGTVLPKLTNMQFLDLRYTKVMLTINDVQGMTTLECFGGNFLDRENYNSYVQQIMDKGCRPQTYHLHLGNISTIYCHYLCPLVPNNNQIINFGDCEGLTHYLPRDTSLIRIHGNGHWKCLCNGLSFENSCSLRRIEIRRCTLVESLCCLTSTCSLRTQMLNLESLHLEELESLTAICKEGVAHVTPPLSERSMFSHLKKLVVYNCNKIEKLLTPGLVPLLQNLEKITVHKCSSMKEIFAEDNGGDDHDGSRSNITLPKLTKLYLSNLPELKIVCKGILFCGLSKPLYSYFCPNLKYPAIQTCNI